MTENETTSQESELGSFLEAYSRPLLRLLLRLLSCIHLSPTLCEVHGPTLGEQLHPDSALIVTTA